MALSVTEASDSPTFVKRAMAHWAPSRTSIPVHLPARAIAFKIYRRVGRKQPRKRQGCTGPYLHRRGGPLCLPCPPLCLPPKCPHPDLVAKIS